MSASSRLYQLIALCGFAFAMPVLRLVLDHESFLRAHGPGSMMSLGAGVLGLILLPPMILWLSQLLLGLVQPRAASFLHTLFIVLLGALGVAANLRIVLPEAAWLFVVLAISAGGLLAFECARQPWLCRLLSWLALAPIVFAGMFLLQPAVRGAAASSPDSPSTQGSAPAAHGPVVVIVFEELPLSSLQRVDGEIDAARYPSFAALAARSTWVPGTTTVATRILDAVPAILTGRYPSLERLDPIRDSYPDNLFTLLAATHDLHVVEVETLLSADINQPPAVPKLREGCLAEDLALVYRHLVTPGASRPTLPSAADGWTCVVADEAAMKRGRDSQIARVKALRRDTARGDDDAQRLRAFFSKIGSAHARSGPERGSLHFAHLKFPTAPWRHTPSGRKYTPYRSFGLLRERWAEEPWWPIEAYQRHLLQLEYCDALLGELVAKLERQQLYDDALIVITADFGIGFRPGEATRSALGASHPEDVLGVPLFIKLPNQKEPARIEAVAQTIDILPSIAHVLGIEVPFAIDGCSLFDEQCEAHGERIERWTLDAPGTGYRKAVSIDPDIVQRRDTAIRKAEIFGEGDTPEHSYRLSPFSSLEGQKIADLDVDPQSAGELTYGRHAAKGRPIAVGVRVSIGLELDSESQETPQIAVALNGVVETIVPAPRPSHPPRSPRMVLAMLPEKRLTGADDLLEFFLVSGPPEAPRLSPLRFRR